MASGDTLLTFLAGHNTPPATNPAIPDQRNNHNVLDYDDTTNWDGVFEGVMPQHYGAGGVTAYLHYSMSTATTGTVDWSVAWERIGDQQQDIDSDGFAAANSVNGTTVPGTSGLVDIVSIAFTNGADMDNVATGEKFRLKVTRGAAGDTASGDAELHAVELRET